MLGLPLVIAARLANQGVCLPGVEGTQYVLTFINEVCDLQVRGSLCAVCTMVCCVHNGLRMIERVCV